MPTAATDLPEGVSLPLNLGLNDGTYMPEACVEVMKNNCHRLALRNYTNLDNRPLKEAIAAFDNITPDHVFLHNGSGPILKMVIPQIIRSRIKSSPRRIVRHMVSGNGYPVITPSFTYSKVPKKSAELGLTLHMVPITSENDFKLDLGEFDAKLSKADGVVYIANPNNPTGNVLVKRDDLIPLLEKYPESRFWIDEAYVQYVDPEEHPYFAELVPHYPNLFVSRTFSFAWGLAGVRMGYMVANPESAAEMESQLTGYTLGTLHEELGIAALGDKEHLPWLRKECAEQRKVLSDGITALGGIEAFPGQANFVLFRFTDGRTGEMLKRKMAEHGIAIKVLAPLAEYSYDPYFRITLGTAAENLFVVSKVAQCLAE